MSESSLVTLAVALIGSVAALGSAAIPLLIATHRRAREAAHDAALTRYQVTNDHKTNLRVESDERHDEIMATLNHQGELLDRNTGLIGNIMTRLEVVEGKAKGPASR